MTAAMRDAGRLPAQATRAAPPLGARIAQSVADEREQASQRVGPEQRETAT